ncbi:hypothetical protein [Nanchangia anserum]|nr:hypothetical protein [Nanchangia anserum]
MTDTTETSHEEQYRLLVETGTPDSPDDVTTGEDTNTEGGSN